MAERDEIGTGRRVIVHCGAQKTGSTSFHHFVQNNAEGLRGRVEVLTPIRGTATRELGRISAQFSLDPKQHEAALIAAIQAVRDQVLGAGCTCIISHENIAGAMMGRSGVNTLYPALPRIIALLERHLAPIRPDYVIYTREIESWKVSVHNQAVKTDNYQRSLAEFLDETRDCGSWEQLQGDLTARLGAERLRFFRLEDEPDTLRPGQQLLEFAGLDGGEIAALAALKRPRNPGLNPGAMEFMRLMKEAGLASPARRKIAVLIKENQQLFVDRIDPEQAAD